MVVGERMSSSPDGEMRSTVPATATPTSVAALRAVTKLMWVMLVASDSP